MNYKDVKVKDEIKLSLEEMGFSEWTEVQELTIPVLQKGVDVIGQSQTGTGKTIAFGIPILEMIDKELDKPQALIMCPTRELAVQVAAEIKKVSKHMKGIKVLPVYGGEDISKQIRDLKKGVQIIVGTPGRLIDHIERRTIRLSDIKLVVLDEADEMLKMGFREDIELILEKVPEKRQTALFSATMPKAIMDIVHKYQNNPEHIIVKPKQITASSIVQEYCEIKAKHKVEALYRVLKMNKSNLVIVFCNRKDVVDRVCDEILKKGFTVDKIHGDLTQNLRLKVISKLKDGLINILVATDVAARGLDISDVELVINYDVPEKEEYYVHRIGRSGRAGKKGKSVTLVTEKDKGKLRDIEHFIKQSITKINLPTLSELKETNVDRYIMNVEAEIREGKTENSKIYNKVLTKLKKEHEVDEILSALIKMNMKVTDDYEIDDINFSFREDKARKGTARENSRKSDGNRRSQKGGARIFMNIGRAHKVTKQEILKFIEKEAGVPQNKIDDLALFESFSFFTTEEKLAKDIIEKLKGKKIKNSKIHIEYAKK